ncbi:MAG: DUF4407 domain-containing protein [Candidatus Pacebacteria bacterium]|nr:DUF4407 domain-containing protein [Candidatus Paceibacterota bacterium]
MLFAWVAGSDLTVIRSLNTAELNKKAAIGLVMVMAITLSAISAGYAATIFLSDKLMVPCALLWGAIVFSIDRALIVFLEAKKAHDINMGNGHDAKAVMGTVAGRVLLILVMSFLTSTAVEMKIFEKEISSVITVKRNYEEAAIAAESDSLRSAVELERSAISNAVAQKANEHGGYIAGLDQQIADMEQSIKERRSKLEEEIAGRVGSGLAGRGPAAQAVENNIKADSLALIEKRVQRNELAASSMTLQGLETARASAEKRFAELDQRLLSIDEAESRAYAQVEQIVSDGFEERFDALHELYWRQPLLMVVVFLMLMAIESMPLLMKLFSGSGYYEIALAQNYQVLNVETLLRRESELAQKQLDHHKILGPILQGIRTQEIGRLSQEASHAVSMKGKQDSLNDSQIAFEKAKADLEKSRFDLKFKLSKDQMGKYAILLQEAEKLNGHHQGNPTLREAEEGLLKRFLDTFKGGDVSN